MAVLQLLLRMNIMWKQFSVAKATLESQMSVSQSVCPKNPLASQNCSYRPSSLLTIEPIWSSFASFKPFGLFQKVTFF